ncbi:MAG: sigma-70 family RNA polymerase sigma factor [Burkholderiales bacterium]|nr:sigma-70 family RNA polymerase sigma factor [Burkholderiales bacterium]
MAVSAVHALADAECAALAKRGDRIAFTELVRRYQGRIFRFVLRMVRGRDDALDLTQDTFVKAWQAFPEWQPQAAVHTWLFQIARNGAIDHLRRHKAIEFVPHAADADIAEPGAGPEDAAETRQRYRLLEAALQAIAPEHREILLLREVEQMSYEEIGASLRLSAGTVKSRIARARAALLTRLPPQP